MKTEPALEPLRRLVGTWTTEATHRAFPGLVVHGTVEISWLEGERFVIHRARTDHADFPDSISIIGQMERDRVDPARGTFDSRGVFREYDVSVTDVEWRIWRDAPGFSQRFTGTLSQAGDSVVGQWDLREDDAEWVKDLAITYRRQR